MKQLPWVMLILVGLGFSYCYSEALKEAGAKDLRIHQLDSLRAVDVSRLDSFKVAYRRDTVRLTKWNTRWRDSIHVKIDTFTVEVPIEVVREVVKTADSTINACLQVINTCEQEQAILRNTIRLDNEEIALLKRPSSLVAKVKNASVWISVGVLLHAIFQ